METCSECGRTLLHSNGALVCCWRHCPAYGVDTTADDEVTAIRDDAERRLVELRAQRERLLANADDPYTLSELVTITSQIASAVKALREQDAA